VLFPIISIKNDHEATSLHREHEETNSKNSICSLTFFFFVPSWLISFEFI
jgi:hypothetical protein